MTDHVNRSTLTRRGFLQATTAAAGLVAGQGLLGFPAVHAADPVVLRIAGTGVNQFQQLADKTKAELGITIHYTSLVSDDVVKRAVTQPTSFDLIDSEYWMLKKIIPSGHLRGMDTTRIKYYDDIVPIFTKGELPDGTRWHGKARRPLRSVISPKSLTKPLPRNRRSG
jgi:putative spermidine/putrescine transport system substrate-binding protein